MPENILKLGRYPVEGKRGMPIYLNPQLPFIHNPFCMLKLLLLLRAFYNMTPIWQYWQYFNNQPKLLPRHSPQQVALQATQRGEHVQPLTWKSCSMQDSQWGKIRWSKIALFPAIFLKNNMNVFNERSFDALTILTQPSALVRYRDLKQIQMGPWKILLNKPGYS